MNDVMDISTTYWDLSFNGESIPFDRKQMILSIELTETVKGADSVTIKLMTQIWSLYKMIFT